MSIVSQLNDRADYYDLDGMNNLVESLSSAELEKNRQAIIEVYELVYRSGTYDLECDKADDGATFSLFLLRLLDSIQRFFPDQRYYGERAICYEYLADYTAAPEDKLHNIEQAIQLYKSATPAPRIHLAMVRVLIDKLTITRQFTPEAFTELQSFFRLVLNSGTLTRALLFQCFRLRTFSLEQHIDWHQRLLQEFEAAMHEQANNNPLVYLDWAEVYQHILVHELYNIDPAYKAAMVAKTALLLQPLAEYDTNDADLLYSLGKSFAETAKQSTDKELSLAYYKTAVDCYTKSHQLKHTLWSFPVYAIQTLTNMAQLYHEQGANGKLVDTFEHGLQFFSKAFGKHDDFELNQYWGDFLIDYAKLAYSYQSPDLIHRAEEKLQLAITQILKYREHPYLSRPYLSLARLAIKTGDKEKCVALLLQCREAIRSKGYREYNLAEAQTNEDFREIWDQLQ